MYVIVRGSFFRDISKYNNKTLAVHIKKTIKQIEEAEEINAIHNLIKLREYHSLYRIKIQISKEKTYRIGLMIRGDKVWLLRFSHRQNIYGKFP